MRTISAVLLAVALGYAVQGHATEARTEKVLYSFCSQQGCPDGNHPLAGLIEVNGMLYGTTATGGNGAAGGTVFSLDPKTHAQTVLYSFCSLEACADGGYPVAGLLNVDGMLYGTTLSGGSAKFCGNGCGTVFSLNPGTGAESVAYSFCSQNDCADGYYPAAGLIDVKGLFYGTTQGGGSYGNGGTVFAFNPATGVENVQHSFQENPDEGYSPDAGLALVNGALYGTTSSGGADGQGVVFSLKGGNEQAFDLGDGSDPLAAPVNYGGQLYGTTYQGGLHENCSYGCGLVYSLDPETGAETTLYCFGGGADGTNPTASLIALGDLLYGTTSLGGSYGGGTVFAIDPATGSETVLYSFCSRKGCKDGANPHAALVKLDGRLYGTTYNGGAYGEGTVFSVTPSPSTLSRTGCAARQ